MFFSRKIEQNFHALDYHHIINETFLRSFPSSLAAIATYPHTTGFRLRFRPPVLNLRISQFILLTL